MLFQLQNMHDPRCLDNHQYLFQAPERLFFEACHFKLATQVSDLIHAPIPKEWFCAMRVLNLIVFCT